MRFAAPFWLASVNRKRCERRAPSGLRSITSTPGSTNRGPLSMSSRMMRNRSRTMPIVRSTGIPHSTASALAMRYIVAWPR